MYKRKIIIPILLFVILSLIVSAFSTLSLDRVDFSTRGDEFDQQWLLLISEDGRADKAVVTKKAEEIKDDKIHAKNDLTIKTEIDKNSCVYTIQNINQPISRLDYTKKTVWKFWDIPNEIKSCEQREGYYWAFNLGFDFNVYCFFTPAGKDSFVGRISDKKYDFNTKITLTSGGESKSVDISNSDRVSNSVPDYFVAKWHGSLSTGAECPDITSLSPIYDRDSGEWKLGEKSSISNYQSFHSSGMKECLNSYIIARTTGGLIVETPDSCKKRYNDLVEKAQSPEVFNIKGSTGSMTTQSSELGELVVEDVQPFQFPVISLKINADWIGIVQPITKPTILSCESSKFKQGEIGEIDVEVKNKGESGSVSISTVCLSPFKSVGTTPIIRLKKGESKSITVPITVSTKEDVSKTCSVTVQDESDPSVRVSKRCDVSASGVVLCEAGKKRCSGRFIEQCKSSGSEYGLIEECELDCKLDKYGQPFCPEVTPPPPPPPNGNGDKCEPIWAIAKITIIPDFICEMEKVPYLKEGISGLVGFVMFIILIFMLKNLIGFENIPQRLMVLGFSLIIAILLGFLFYYLFWFGVALIVALVVMFFVIKIILGKVGL
tara:strand:+ start:857 stop:2671 length:1815 start_codon:yes stop_codon:yes gene_type:complete